MEEDAPLNVSGGSPTKVSRGKAQTGAQKAAEAAALAQRLLNQTRNNISAASLNDLKLPCLPISPLTVEAEERKAANADTVAPSPWCAAPHRPSAPIPLDPAAPQFVELQNANLAALACHRPLSYNDAIVLGDVIGFGVEGIKQLDLRRALIASQAPPPPADRLQHLMAQIEAEVGPEDNQENVEKLQQMVEKAKGEFSTYEKGIRFLAEKKLDRFAALCHALLKGSSLLELNLASNQLGAPNADGKSNFHDLRQLSRVIDETSSLRNLDLCANNMGPVGVGIVAKAMTKNITITTLNLAGNDICLAEPPEEEDDPDKEEEDPVFGEFYNGLEAISELIKKNKFLRNLGLRNNGIKGEIDEAGEDDGAETPLGKLLEPLKKYHRLEVLDLASNELGPGGARTLAVSLSLNHSIHVLDLSDNAIGVAGLSHIAKFIVASTSIANLVLSKNDITVKKDSKRAHKQAVDVFTAFAAAVAGSVTLRSLCLSGHRFGPQYSAILLNGIQNSRVTQLQFAGNDLCGTPDAPASDLTALNHVIAAMMRSSDEPLRTVNLSGNHIGVPGAQALAPVLPTLLSADLSRNGLGNDGLASIAAVLSSGEVACTLEKLDLSHNNLKACFPVLGNILLATRASLKSLDLSSNPLAGDELHDMMHFGEFVSVILNNCSNGGVLSSLNLASTGLHRGLVFELIRLVQYAQPPFGSLDLIDNPLLTLEDAQKLIATLANNASLYCLRISSQYGDRTGLITAALETLRVNRRIVDLDLCLPTDIEEATVEQFRYALLHNSLIGIDRSLY